MRGATHFERLSGWLRGQTRSVERVEIEQGSATYLVNTADYELCRMRADLANLALEPGTGIARLSQINPLLADTPRGHAQPAPATLDTPATPGRKAHHAKDAQPKPRRHASRLADRLRAANSDAA